MRMNAALMHLHLLREVLVGIANEEDHLPVDTEVIATITNKILIILTTEVATINEEGTIVAVTGMAMTDTVVQIIIQGIEGTLIIEEEKEGDITLLLITNATVPAAVAVDMSVEKEKEKSLLDLLNLVTVVEK